MFFFREREKKNSKKGLSSEAPAENSLDYYFGKFCFFGNDSDELLDFVIVTGELVRIRTLRKAKPFEARGNKGNALWILSV